MKKLLVLFAFIACGALAQAAAPNDADTVWFRWYQGITDVCWSPDDSTIAAFDGFSQEVSFINPIDGAIKKQMWAPYAYGGAQYAKDGSFVLLNEGGGDYYPTTPYLIYTKTYEPRSDFEHPGTPSRYYTLSPANTIVASSEDGTTLRMWDVETGRIFKTKTLGSNYDSTISINEWKRKAIRNVKFTGDGKYLLVRLDSVKKIFDKGYYDEYYEPSLYLVDTANMDIIKEYWNKYGPHDNVVPSKTGKYFLSFNEDAVVPHRAFRITDVESGEVIFDVWGYQSAVPDVDFSSDDRFVAFPVNMELGTEHIEVWDILKNQMVYTYNRNPLGPFNTVGFSNDNNFLIATSSARAYLYRTEKFNSTENEIPVHSTISYPNPAHCSITIDFSLTKAATTKVEILDMAGNSLSTVADEMMAEGAHTLTADLAGLPVGTYFIRISSAGNTSTSKFVINK